MDAARLTRIFFVASIFAVASHAAALTPENGSFWHEAGHWTTYAGALVLGIIALLHAARTASDRAIWALVGVGLVSWVGSTVYHTLLVSTFHGTHPWNAGDVLSIGYFAATFVLVVLLVRSRIGRIGVAPALDAVLAMLVITAAGATIVFGPVFHGSPSAIDAAATFAQPLFDLVVAATLVGVLGLMGWRLHGVWVFAAGIIGLNAAIEAVALRIAATEIDIVGRMFDSLCPVAILALGYVAAHTSGQRIAQAAPGWRRLAVPGALAAAALVLEATTEIAGSSSWLTETLLWATFALLVIRMVLAVRDQSRMLDASRAEAQTDALTDLGNRRALAQDLDAVFAAAPGQAHVLMLFDLDGFKAYNDTFGHPAGDRLLQRLGRRLGDAAAPYGRAYRLGGDEFCLLASADERRVEAIVHAGSRALSECGEGFAVTVSYGACIIPNEATSATDALQLADRRLYERKNGRPESAREQAAEVLARALRERDRDLGAHTTSVAALAGAVAQRLGLLADEVDEVVRTAELHDIGKLAIPEAILQKPDPLTDDEWRFMKEHTVIGERILSAVPALQRIARNVRSSHERWDGRGYPDNLAAEEIPLAARITLACDAYDCIVSGRAYRPARSHDEAVGELLRNAGAQFDPDVVFALVDVLDSGRLEAPGDQEQDIERDITRRLLAALRSADRVPAGAAVAVAASAGRA